jgi:hypothetical protein
MSMTPQSHAGTLFTFDSSLASPNLGGGSVTADTINIVNYLHSTVQANGAFSEQLIQPVSGFTLGGSTVMAPGLNSSYGLYFLVDATGTLIAGKTTFSTLDISLKADVNNNDGTPVAALGTPGMPGSVAFSNPSGVADDVTLGSGSLVTASMSMDAAGVRHANYLTTYTPASGEGNFYVLPAPFADLLNEALTTLPSEFASSTPDPTTGQFEIAVNGGGGDVQFNIPEPAAVVMLIMGICGLGMVRRRRPPGDRALAQHRA